MQSLQVSWNGIQFVQNGGNGWVVLQGQDCYERADLGGGKWSGACGFLHEIVITAHWDSNRIQI